MTRNRRLHPLPWRAALARRHVRAGHRASVWGGAVLALVALSACGTDLNPGAAVTVGDASISQGEVDELVTAACEYTRAGRVAEGADDEPATSIAFLRTSLTQQLIQAELAGTAAEELGLTVDDSQVTALAAGNELPDGVDPAQEEVLRDFFEDQARALLDQAVVGAHLRDESITVADDTLTQEDVDGAADYLAEVATEEGVDVNPAYGSWDGSAIVAGSGSLSDPVSQLAKSAVTEQSGDSEQVADLPASQVCG